MSYYFLVNFVSIIHICEDYQSFFCFRKYKNDGFGNFYHIGAITSVNPLVITHATSPNAKQDKKFNANVLVCWFIGASIVDTSNVLKKTVSSKENSINKKYREYIQEQIYKKFRINNQLFKTAQIQICDRTRKQILEAPGSVFSSFKAFHTQLSKNKYKLEGGFGLVNEMIYQGMDYVSQSPNLDQSNSIPMIIVIHAAHDIPRIIAG